MKTQTYPSPKTGKSIALLLLGIGLILIGIASVLLIPRAAEATIKTDTPASTASNGVSVIPAKVNFPAPALQLSDISGQAYALSDFTGQVVLVNNWAIWCPPCKRELPDLERFFQEHKAQGFTIIAIESGSPAEEVTQFVQQAGLSFPIWLDPQEVALDTFLNRDIPNSYVMDRTGQVRLAWTGAINFEMLEKHVAPMLSE